MNEPSKAAWTGVILVTERFGFVSGAYVSSPTSPASTAVANNASHKNLNYKPPKESNF